MLCEMVWVSADSDEGVSLGLMVMPESSSD